MLPHSSAWRSTGAIAITATLEWGSNEQGALDARREIDEFAGD
jgi:hypothetical protein